DGNGSPGICYWFTSQIHLIDIGGARARIISSYQLGDEEHPRFVALGDDVLFMHFSRTDNVRQLTLLRGLSGGTIQRSEVAMPTADRYPTIEALRASGNRATLFFTDRLVLVDASDDAPTAVTLSSTALGNPSAVLMDDEAAYRVLGSHGVQRIALPPL